MKSVCLITRRADLTRAAFRDYYETRHCLLGMRHFPFSKYVRNHLTADDGVDFDCLSEFWQDDTAQAYDIMGSETGDILRADERNFMNQTKIRPAASEEVLIAGVRRSVDRLPARRTIFLLRRAKSASPTTFLAALDGFAHDVARLSPDALRVTLDKTAALAAPTAFPYDALLSVWGDAPRLRQSAEMPRDVALCGIVTAEICESPPELLAAQYGKG